MCCKEVGRGKRHKCTGGKKEKLQHLNSIVRSNSENTVSSFICTNLKAKASKQEISGKNQGMVTPTSGGPNRLKVKIMNLQAAKEKKMVTHGDFLDIQRTIECSDRKLLGLRRCLAVILGEIFDGISTLHLMTESLLTHKLVKLTNILSILENKIIENKNEVLNFDKI